MGSREGGWRRGGSGGGRSGGLDDFPTADSEGGVLGAVGSLKITRNAPFRSHPLHRPSRSASLSPGSVGGGGVGAGVRGVARPPMRVGWGAGGAQGWSGAVGGAAGEEEAAGEGDGVEGEVEGA
ncbi:hypothetical protein GCM10010502_50970 [Kitasatospora aureofaciens]|uniref:Uncharacterized protein n=1 Tax=Kitasatospora aureofaciens TaxID=1894 RepID=A0A8H9HX60_KITAU|nr:hypothetical protein GCM10010502_50970 [Kitasatospora aureofaciens]